MTINFTTLTLALTLSHTHTHGANQGFLPCAPFDDEVGGGADDDGSVDDGLWCKQSTHKHHQRRVNGTHQPKHHGSLGILEV